MTPKLESLDHIHIYVADRSASEEWYARVLGLRRIPEWESWATEGGPLTIGNPSGTVHLALFERPTEKCRSTVALGTTGSEFLAWRTHLAVVLGHPLMAVDHSLSWSLYFNDPDGNPFEITSYEYKQIAGALGATGA